MAKPELVKSKLYSAEKANEDWDKKVEEKKAHVSDEKMLDILDTIKAQIDDMDTGSESGSLGYKFYDYYGYLSPGEQKFLEDLNYKVKFEENYDSMHGDYYRISW